MSSHAGSRVWPVLMMSVVLAFCAAGARGDDSRLTARVSAVRVDANLDYRSSTDEGEPVRISAAAGNGWMLGAEIGLTPRLGLELDVLEARPDLTLEVRTFTGTEAVSAQSELRTRMLAAGLALHLASGRYVDVRVSPIIALLSFDDLSFSATGPDGAVQALAVEIRDDFAWGVGLGVDIALGDSPWVATAQVRYLDSRLEAKTVDDASVEIVDFDPVTLSLGVGYRF